MKVLYHHRTSAQDGSAVHIEGLIGALRRGGAEVSIVSPPSSSAAPGAQRSKSWIHSVRRKMPRWAHELAELAYNVPEALRLLRAIRSWRPDVIYQRSNLYLLSGAWVAKRTGTPLIEEVNAPYFLERSKHGGISLQSLAQWSEQASWKQADAIVAVSEVLAEIVVEHGVARDRMHVMPNGIDRTLLQPDAVDQSAKVRLGLGDFTVLGFTGFVRDWNGLDAVLDVLVRPEAQRWLLLVVGDGPARSLLESRARELGISERVRFTGLVTRAEIPGFVSAFDIALQPAANRYASPLKLIEYMALGRAIVAPDQPNIREILTDGTDALLFRPGDPSDLAAKLMRISSEAALRERLSKAAVETLRRRQLSWDHNAARVRELAGRLSARRADLDRASAEGAG